MKNIKLFSVLILIFLATSCLQDTVEKVLVSVNEPTDIITLKKGYYKGKFSPDGNRLLFTDQSNNGLSVFNVGENKLSMFTKSVDAGLEAFYSHDGKTLYYTTHDFEDKKRMTSLFLLNIEDGTREILVDKIRNLKLVYGSTKSILFYDNGQPREYDIESGQFLAEATEHVGTFSDTNLNLAIYKNGEAIIINPVGEGNYLWPSLSPDKKKVLFTVSGKGSYISDLDGRNLINLGRLHAPRWSADGKYVIGMDDQDDGQQFTSSDIILITVDGKKKQNLTKNTDIIALYPDISPDGKKIVFNDEKGTAYLMDIL